MAFKYLNPGYVPMSYEFANNQSVMMVRSNIYNPRCGVALISDNIDCVFENVMTNDTDYLCIKFDIFLPAETTTTETTTVQIPIKGELLRISQTGTTVELVQSFKGYSVEDTNLKLGRVNTVLLEINTSHSTWRLAVYVNDGDYPVFNDYSESTNYSGTIKSDWRISASISNKHPISNIIISDNKINFKEIIIEVDSSAIEATMTERADGTYSTAQVGDYVLKTLDTSGLYGNFGSDCEVLGMALFAAPAFNTDSNGGVSLIKGRTVNGLTVTDYSPPKMYFSYEDNDYDYFQLQTMTEEDFAEINTSETLHLPCYYLQLPVTANTTLADLNGLKVGWVSSDFE